MSPRKYLSGSIVNLDDSELVSTGDAVNSEAKQTQKSNHPHKQHQLLFKLPTRKSGGFTDRLIKNPGRAINDTINSPKNNVLSTPSMFSTHRNSATLSKTHANNFGMQKAPNSM